MATMVAEYESTIAEVVAVMGGSVGSGKGVSVGVCVGVAEAVGEAVAVSDIDALPESTAVGDEMGI